MGKWKKGLSILALAGLLTLTLTACGSGDDSAKEGGGNGDIYKVGISQYVNHPSLDAATKGFKKALQDAGLDVEYDEQNAQGEPNNAKTAAQNLVNSGVDLIFANATPSAQAAAGVTGDIPVVFTSVTDPVGAELIESMEKPGRNVTGTTDMHPDAIPNTVKFIAEELDDVEIVGTIYNAGEQNSVKQVEEMKKAIESSGLTLVEKVVSNTSEVKQAADSLAGEVDAIYIITDNTVVSALESVVSVARQAKVPLFVGELDSVERGGFAAYGFDYFDIGYEAGQLAVQILKDGKAPADIPSQYPQNLKLVINKTAAEEMDVELKPEWDDIAEYIE